MELERQLKFNYSFKFPFKVINRLDLNHEGEEIKHPLKGDISKKFFLGFGSSALNISAEIPFRGYVGGQKLSVAVQIDNDSSVEVEKVLVELRRLYRFKCDSISTKNESEVLIRGNHDGVPVKSKAHMTFTMEMPSVEPTNVRICKYINIYYEIVVIAKVRGFHRSPELTIPVTIGTFPLSGFEIASTSDNLQSPPPTYENVFNTEKGKLFDETKN